MGGKLQAGAWFMFHVRPMFRDDFGFAVGITKPLGWELSEADFEFMLELEPEGCFVLLEDSERIGLATTISFGLVGWFGNLLILDNRRNRGAGSMLVEHSIKYLSGKGVKTVGLYAYMDRIHFYERLGFKRISDFMILKGKGVALSTSPFAREAEKQDVQEIMEFDRSCFGADRRKLLEPILLDEGNICYVSVQKGSLTGYAVAKLYGHKAEVGPLICSERKEDVAVGLLTSLLSKLEGRDVSLYVSNEETSIINSLKKLGFSESSRVARMFLGPQALGTCLCMAESLERG